MWPFKCIPFRKLFLNTFVYMCIHMTVYCMCVVWGCICGGHEISCCIISCLNPLGQCLLRNVELGWQPLSHSDPSVSAFPCSIEMMGMSSFWHGYWRSEPGHSGLYSKCSNPLNHLHNPQHHLSINLQLGQPGLSSLSSLMMEGTVFQQMSPLEFSLLPERLLQFKEW